MRPINLFRSLLAVALLLAALLPPVAAADDFVPGPGATGNTTVIGFIESPSFGQVVSPGGGFTVSGWVVDRSAEGWTGIVQVEVYDGPIEAGGRLIGVGPANIPRPDVEAFFGNPFWLNSGFSVQVPGGSISWGLRTLAVYAVTPDRGRWFLSIPILGQALQPSATDEFPREPLIRVFDPLPAAVVRASPTIMRGIALDRNSPIGPGTDLVEIYIDGPREAGGQLLATAQTGRQYGDAGLEFHDRRFDLAGWEAVWEPRQFARGEHELFVYARRAGTDVWNVTRVRFLIEH